MLSSHSDCHALQPPQGDLQLRKTEEDSYVRHPAGLDQCSWSDLSSTPAGPDRLRSTAAGFERWETLTSTSGSIIPAVKCWSCQPQSLEPSFTQTAISDSPQKQKQKKNLSCCNFWADKTMKTDDEVLLKSGTLAHFFYLIKFEGKLCRCSLVERT